MSLTQAPGGRVIHVPANPDAFQFDAEVARIFPDMAERSIPMYHEAHRAHVAMLGEKFREDRIVKILDVGASRAAFYSHLVAAWGDAGIDYTALDASKEMLGYIANDYPDANMTFVEMNVGSIDFFALREKYDVIVANYIVQFVKPDYQFDVVRKLLDMLAPEGVLLFGHKARHVGGLGPASHGEYINFRLRNGYTTEEIEAKTRALLNSMWPMDHDALVRFIRAEGYTVTETTRWMMFNTFAATKGV